MIDKTYIIPKYKKNGKPPKTDSEILNELKDWIFFIIYAKVQGLWESMMSRHKIRIHEIEIEDLTEIFYGSQSQAYFWRPEPPQTLNNAIKKTPPMISGSKSFHVSSRPLLNLPSTQLPSTQSWIERWSMNNPVYKKYPLINKKYNHIENLDIATFKNFLFNEDFISINEIEEHSLEEYIDLSVINEDMVVKVEFLKNSKKLYANKKVFKRNKGDKSSFYFDETIPSVLEYSSATEISYHMIFDDDTLQSYMSLNYYGNLGVTVKIIVNPNPEKIVPAVVVSDLDGNPLEVHCYYKNKYIKSDMLSELKPNILNEDFKALHYFDKRDLDFLDMVTI